MIEDYPSNAAKMHMGFEKRVSELRPPTEKSVWGFGETMEKSLSQQAIPEFTCKSPTESRFTDSSSRMVGNYHVRFRGGGHTLPFDQYLFVA